jgi:hypothetical protein
MIAGGNGCRVQARSAENAAFDEFRALLSDSSSFFRRFSSVRSTTRRTRLWLLIQFIHSPKEFSSSIDTRRIEVEEDLIHSKGLGSAPYLRLGSQSKTRKR